MLKFECSHDIFEVVSIARFVPGIIQAQCVLTSYFDYSGYLNRQVILLLCHAGVPDAPFIDMQKEVITDLHEMLIDAKVAKKV